MKYPQLVSTKAVNEISDWLIKRLEDLDIEHPCVYSRHLLSLLHTRLKLNAIDLLEQDIEQPYRLLNKNNEELKRLAAVESLMKISSQENKSKIVNLVDELHLKLQMIENNSEEMNGKASNSVAASSPNQFGSSNAKFFKNNLKKIKRHHASENSSKNYYTAFPALNDMVRKSKIESTCVESDYKEEAKSLNPPPWSNLIASSSLSKKNTQKMASNQLEEAMSGAKSPPNQQHRRKHKRYEKKECYNSKRTIQKAKNITAEVQSNNNITFSPKKMQKVKCSNANNNVNNNLKAKHQRNFYDSSTTKRIVNGSRDTNLSIIAQNAPKWDGSGALGPWDMDFKGHWEMDHDLIGEFIRQQQQCNNSFERQMKSFQNESANEDDKLLMKCLPTKLIDDPLADRNDLWNTILKPDFCNNKEDKCMDTLRSKFDERVKAIWNDNDPVKQLTYKQLYAEDDGISLASLASSFASEKNSLSLFNFNEQQQQQQNQQQRNFVIEINVPPFYNEMTSSYEGGGKAFVTEHDYNNNMHGGRGAMKKNNSALIAVSPFKPPPLPSSSSSGEYFLKKSDFIKSGTNVCKSIWSDDFSNEVESVKLKEEIGDQNKYTEIDQLDSTLKHQGSNNWHITDTDDEEVSFFNHSQRSAFKKYRKKRAKPVAVAPGHQLNGNKSRKKTERKKSRAPSEIDYLTSEKTHFDPIFRNGHFFSVDDSYLKVNWELSENGDLMLNDKRYQVFKHRHINLSDDELDIDAIEEDAAGPDDFQVKFAIIQNDKGTQTVDNPFEEEDNEPCYKETSKEIGDTPFLKYVNQIHETRKEYFHEWRPVSNENENSNDYSFFSVNRKKSNVAKENLEPYQNFQPALLSLAKYPYSYESKKIQNGNAFEHDLRYTSMQNSASSSMSTLNSNFGTTSANEPYALESWDDYKFRCIQQIERDRRHTCMHSLWEQCMICVSNNNDDNFIEKPLPANRLLKDELSLEGDEIMNVIQNLYITGDYCDDTDEKEDECDDFDVHHVMNIISMDDDSMDGIGHEDEKFYETAIDLKKGTNSKSQVDIDEFEMAKMKSEQLCNLLQSLQNSLIKPDSNNNECFETSRSSNSNNRKRRHSTCQNLMEKKRYHSQEEEFSPSAAAFFQGFTKNSLNVKSFFLDASKMLEINIEKVLLIADPCVEIVENPCESEEFKRYQQQLQEKVDNSKYCGANYYRNILQQQHALVKNLDLSRPLTR